MTVKKWLKLSGQSPKRARQHFKAELNYFLKGKVQAESDNNSYLSSEYSTCIQDTIIKLVDLDTLITDK